MRVQKTKCNQCLFTKNRVVSEEVAAKIIKTALKKDTYFNCHKTQVKGLKSNVCCKGFWDAHKNNFNLGRVAQRLGIVEKVIIK